MGTFSDTLIDAIEQGKRNARKKVYFEGFDDAANICIEIVNSKIEMLFSKINSGKSPTTQEQFLVAQLNELKKEIDGELIKFVDSMD